MILKVLLCDTGLCSQTVNLIVKRNIALGPVLYRIIKNYPKLKTRSLIACPGKNFTLEDKLVNSLKYKLVYNSLITKKNSLLRWKVRQIKQRNKEALEALPSVPLSLKYFDDTALDFYEYQIVHGYNSTHDTRAFDENKTADDNKRQIKWKKKKAHDDNEELVEDKSENINFPYGIVKKVDIRSDFIISDDSSENVDNPKKKNFQLQAEVESSFGKGWMSDYEVYEEDLNNTDKVELSGIEYGTCDPNVLPSKIPCGGCGAHLHCQNPSIPGYLPTEIFLRSSEKDLKLMVCQRCTFLKHYNIALSVNVDPESYPKLLSSLKNKDALVVLLVDMLDFPCSIWPKMLDIIGKDKPVMLVGNKIDLIPGDNPNWLENAKKVLRESFPSRANIIHTSLISAATGYGVEELITKLNVVWLKEGGDVYLVGCTNVGKSSLFNDLLHSDYCKSKAINLIQRATTSPWPGTTLNLLKFPIQKFSSWKAYCRVARLNKEKRMLIQERELDKLQMKERKQRLNRLPQIIGQIGITFDGENKNFEKGNNFAMPAVRKILKEDERKTFDPNDPNFVNSKWCYDTPGVVNPDQIINILTHEEITKVLPDSVIKPRIYSVYSEQTIFIGGLARIDLVQSDYKFIRIIIYSSEKLPITLCETQYVDDVYNKLLGTSYMAVPCGSAERLKQWPQLKSTQDFEFVGAGNVTAVSDIVLSNAGWISVLSKYGSKFIVRPFTPEGRGIYLRKNPLLKQTALSRKRRVANTPTYYMSHNR